MNCFSHVGPANSSCIILIELRFSTLLGNSKELRLKTRKKSLKGNYEIAWYVSGFLLVGSERPEKYLFWLDGEC